MTEALNIGHKVSGADLDKSLTLCEFAEGVHAFLSALAEKAGWWQAIVLRAAAGWVSNWRRSQNCV